MSIKLLIDTQKWLLGSSLYYFEPILNQYYHFVSLEIWISLLICRSISDKSVCQIKNLKSYKNS